MGRPVVHWELWSEDPNALTDFYKSAFDWESSFISEMNYHLVDTGGEGGINGGVMTPKQGPWPGKMTMYIDVDDIDRYVDRVRDAGGKIVVEKTEMPGVGFMALFEDLDGRVLGLWQQVPESDQG